MPTLLECASLAHINVIFCDASVRHGVPRPETAREGHASSACDRLGFGAEELAGMLQPSGIALAWTDTSLC